MRVSVSALATYLGANRRTILRIARDLGITVSKNRVMPGYRKLRLEEQEAIMRRYYLQKGELPGAPQGGKRRPRQT